MNLQKTQTLYIAIDDSGQLSNKELYTIFGGIIFFTNNSIQEFNNNYKLLINKLQNKYKKLKELKSCFLKQKDRNLIMNYLKNYPLLGVVIDNKKIYRKIINNSKSKGRYLDYAIKMMLKNTLKWMIFQKIINPYENVNIYIYIDETTYKSNGLYSLKESIYNELKYGMGNIHNSVQFKNILYGNLNIEICYLKSHLSYIIQASDIIAGNIRHQLLIKNSCDFIDYLIFLPKK